MQGGLYAETLREEIRAERMTLEEALDFMTQHHVHPRIAAKLLGAAYEEKNNLTEDTDAL